MEVKSCESLVDGAVGAEVVEIPVVVSLGFGLKKKKKRLNKIGIALKMVLSKTACFRNAQGTMYSVFVVIF